MPQRCLIPGCVRESDSLFKAPKNVERRALWIKAVRDVYPDLLVRENFLVCEKHFRKSDFSSFGAPKIEGLGIVQKEKRTRLNQKAVPCFDMLILNADNLLMEQEGLGASANKLPAKSKRNRTPKTNSDLSQGYVEIEVEPDITDIKEDYDHLPSGVVEVKIERDATDEESEDMYMQDMVEIEIEPDFSVNIKIENEDSDDSIQPSVAGSSEFDNNGEKNDTNQDQRRIEVDVKSEVGEDGTIPQNPVSEKHEQNQEGLRKAIETYQGKRINEGPHECSTCHTKFTCKQNLRRHLRVHTGEKPYECNVCHTRFSEKVILTRHLRTHTGEKPFECHICNRSFGHSSTLRLHLRRHTGEKPFECNFCQSKFSESVALKRHLRRHTGEKPYECSICNRRFGHSGSIYIHMRTHTGEKPFECTVCQTRFSDRVALKLHSRLHTGEKPHECNICKRRFGHRSSYRIHMRTHTGERPFECSVCEMKFKEKATLKRHLKVHVEKPVVSTE